VDEMDRTTESRAEKVLRAADVLPPFDEEVPPGNNSDPKASAPARPRGKTDKSKRKNRRAGAADSGGQRNAVERNMPGDSEIPTFDLAESILARQRRVTAGRRKKRSQAASKTDSRQNAVRLTYIDELSAQEQAELQQVVAKIVARDIERLCCRSNESVPVQSSASR